jgi:RimJ/RimL family protein N-acetyltransferase
LISFQPVTAAHRPLLESWLSQPHWQEWWGTPEEELQQIYAVEEGEHLPFIACVDGEPIAYIQYWWPSKHTDVDWARDMQSTERGIDISIGDASHLGKGLGTRILTAFAAKLFADGATRLLIDPNKRNARAIAAYRKVGFTPVAEIDGDLLMELLPENFDTAAGYAQN